MKGLMLSLDFRIQERTSQAERLVTFIEQDHIKVNTSFVQRRQFVIHA